VEDKLYPIYSLWHKPFWQTTPFYVAIVILVVLVVFLLLWILIRRYFATRKKGTAWDKAIADLLALRNLLREKKISDQAFYLSLTSILKRYLYERFLYDLFGKTDREVILFLEKDKFDATLLNTIKDMFDGLQYIKFANDKAIREKMDKDLNSCIDIVKKTVPIKGSQSKN